MALLVAGGGIWWYAGGGWEDAAADKMKDIENQVAADAVTQYQIAQRQGDPIQICVQAMSVAAAYLQAKDEPNYQQWKATQKSACRKAGMPE